MNVWLILARFSAGNHPFGFRFCPRAQLSIRHTSPSKADLQITKRVAAAAQILQINFPDHVIIGQGYFSFREAGLL